MKKIDIKTPFRKEDPAVGVYGPPAWFAGSDAAIGIQAAVNNAEEGNGKKTFVFNALPHSVADITSDSQFDRTDPFCVAAYSVAALCVYMEDASSGLEMLKELQGPKELSMFDMQFLKDRISEGYTYVPRSYFEGAVPGNNYTPDMPYTITVSDNPYSYPEGEIKTARLLIRSGGADNERFITLRLKPSTGEWFLWEWMGVLAGIRKPESQDPWA